MDIFKAINGLLMLAIVSGCASVGGANGPRGPQLEASGVATESGQYAQVGVKFTSMGDFVALFSPSRWKEPVQTGGSLSWLNPGAWGDDFGRTGRIFIGEAVVVGTAVAVGVAAGGGDGGDSGSTTATPVPPGDPDPPPDGPPGGPGGGSPPTGP